MPITPAEIVQRLRGRPTPSAEDLTQIRSALVGDVLGTLQRFVRAFVPQTALDFIDEWFPWARDQRLAMDPNSPDEERSAAIERLLTNVWWAPEFDRDDRVRGEWLEVRKRAESEQRPPRELKHEILAEAVILVLSDRERSRRVRVGRGDASFYLREHDDADTGVRPMDFPYSADPDVAGNASEVFSESPYLYWFRREVPRAATAILLGEPYPPSDANDQDAWARERSSFDDASGVGAEAEGDPLLATLSAERYREASQRLAAVLEQATPRQRELLLLLETGMTIAEAARTLGIAEATARVQMKRLRDKVV